MAFQKLCRPDRTGLEFATAVGADVLQVALHAVAAKGAFEAADHGFAGFGRQGESATLA